MALHTEFPVTLLWGPELVLLYNDAVTPADRRQAPGGTRSPRAGDLRRGLAPDRPVAGGRPGRRARELRRGRAGPAGAAAASSRSATSRSPTRRSRTRSGAARASSTSPPRPPSRWSPSAGCDCSVGSPSCWPARDRRGRVTERSGCCAPSTPDLVAVDVRRTAGPDEPEPRLPPRPARPSGPRPVLERTAPARWRGCRCTTTAATARPTATRGRARARVRPRCCCSTTTTCCSCGWSRARWARPSTGSRRWPRSAGSRPRERAMSETLQRSLLGGPATVGRLRVAVRYQPARPGPDRRRLARLVRAARRRARRRRRRRAGPRPRRRGRHGAGEEPAARHRVQPRRPTRRRCSPPSTAPCSVSRSTPSPPPSSRSWSRPTAATRLRWSNAGHPPPLLLAPDGDGAAAGRASRSCCSASAPGVARTDHTVDLPSRLHPAPLHRRPGRAPRRHRSTTGSPGSPPP